MSKPTDLILIIILLTLIKPNLSTQILPTSTKPNPPQNNHLQTSFDQYILKYNKNYSNEEEKAQRCKIYQANVQKLRQSSCSACGINKFTDLSQDQIQGLRGIKMIENQRTGLRATEKESEKPMISSSASSQHSNTTTDSTENTSSQTPKTFDWRDYGVITSVKNQLKCGVCWAFSTCAFFQSQLIRRGQAKQTIDLSEQYLFQCDSMSNGCKGGNLYSPMDLVLARGLPFEATYPYNPQVGYPGICRISRGPVFSFSSRVTKYNLTDSQLIYYLLQRPLNIGIKSNDWQKYSPTEEDRTFECKEIKNGKKEYNHAVLLVGYTETEWIVKNQWGDDWGVGGYMYITRNANYNCGIGLQINTLNFRHKGVRVNGGTNETSRTDNNGIGNEKKDKQKLQKNLEPNQSTQTNKIEENTPSLNQKAT